MTETKTVDRQTVRLRATQKGAGDSHVTGVAVTTVAVGVLVPVAAPFFLLRKGKDITVTEGTHVDAFVDGEHLLSNAQAATETAADKPLTQLTNEDILSLIHAGFTDDLIVAKIKGSRAAYKLTTNDLVQLKNAGISERVITAMVEASK